MDINNLFRLAAEKKASDVHLLSGLTPTFRIDGQLVDINTIVVDGNFLPISNQDLEGCLDQIITREQKARFFDKRDLDFGHQIDSYRYRVNLSFEKGNINIVARIIDNKIPTLEEAGLPPVVQNLLDLPQGFILVTGPTGCGKSTTLASMIGHINKTRRANIITLEDPIEYIFTPDKSIVAQRQLGTDMLTFASGLKHVLRQDPNVIMVGEMRDLETIAAAVTVAETGHLVLATLHTYSAAQTVDRIIDIFPAHQQGQIKSQLSGVLTAVISQRLLSRKSGGRIAAREILLNNDAVGNLIREGKMAQITSTIETHAGIGMTTLDRDIKRLYQAGEIDREVALRQMSDPDMLDN